MRFRIPEGCPWGREATEADPPTPTLPEVTEKTAGIYHKCGLGWRYLHDRDTSLFKRVIERLALLPATLGDRLRILRSSVGLTAKHVNPMAGMTWRQLRNPHLYPQPLG